MMRRVRKKRGWVYRVALGVVSSIMFAVGILWLLSVFWTFSLYCKVTSTHGISLEVVPGTARISYHNLSDIDSFSFDARPSRNLFRDENGSLQPVPFQWWNFDWNSYDWQIMQVIFPLWVPLLALAIWPLCIAIRYARSEPMKNVCAACGYDLRGSKGSATCPECGEPTPRQRSTNPGHNT